MKDVFLEIETLSLCGDLHAFAGGEATGSTARLALGNLIEQRVGEIPGSPGSSGLRARQSVADSGIEYIANGVAAAIYQAVMEWGRTR